MRILGATLGDPFSAATYSGVPYYLFAELENSGFLAGRLNVDLRRPVDFLRGFVDYHRTLGSVRPVRNAYWRFMPENIELQTRRLKQLADHLPKHDAVLQIGVGGIPAMPGVSMAAHAEISVEAAANLEIFSKSYGFARNRNRLLPRAISGELEFLSACEVIWTNTEWTADTFAHHGLPREKFWVHAPACNSDDPGPVERQPDSTPHVLFVGKDWVRKGGPLLIEAFAILRGKFPEACLTVIGCDPDVREPGVRVIGFLDKKKPEDAGRIDKAFREATVFCMPSRWESVGLVYMEAALYGLPVVMLRGQCRDGIFPETMAFHLDRADRRALAEYLIHLHERPDVARRMGNAGRGHVLENYTWPVVARRLVNRLEQAGAA